MYTPSYIYTLTYIYTRQHRQIHTCNVPVKHVVTEGVHERGVGFFGVDYLGFVLVWYLCVCVCV